MKRAGAVLGWLVAVGCGGGGASSPSPPTPAPAPVIRSGATDAVVPAEIQPPNPALGAAMVVRAAGFLVREQIFNGQPVYLWPDLGQDFVRALSYGVAFQPGVPSDRLIKWTTGFSVTASESLLSDPGVAAALQVATAEATRASGLPVTVAAAGPVVVSIEPRDPLFAQQPAFGGFTVIVARSDRMESARVVFRDLQQARRADLLSHELGHVLGLSHVSDPAALMFGGVVARGRFDDRELLCLRMMYTYRSPGNRFPDRDPTLGAAAGTRQVAVFADCEQGQPAR